jgi:hypothetical protein
VNACNVICFSSPPVLSPPVPSVPSVTGYTNPAVDFNDLGPAEFVPSRCGNPLTPSLWFEDLFEDLDTYLQLTF